MRLARLVAQAELPREEVLAPSPVHEQLIVLIEGLVTMRTGGAGSTHPLQAVIKRLIPSLTRDLTEIPEADLRKMCHVLARAMESVAQAGLQPALEVGDMLEVPTTVEDDADAQLEPGPAIAALPTG